MPGRCGYCPGRGGSPGVCVRTGCDGNGRGPPMTGGCGRDPGYRGRGGPPGRAGGGGPPGRTPGLAPGAAVPAAAADGRAVAGTAGRSTRAGRGAIRGGVVVGNGGAGAVGRRSS